MSERSFRTSKKRESGEKAKKKDSGKRERILDAAVRVFAKSGYQEARVADVAKAAGVADGTIYLYFESKEDLLVKLFEDRVERLLSHLRTELPKEHGAANKLRRIVQLQLGILEEERELAEVLTVILRQSSTLMKEYAAPKFNEYLESVAEVVVRGQKSGELRTDISPHVVARAIFGALDGLAMTWALGKAERGALVRAADQLAEILLHGLAKA